MTTTMPMPTTRNWKRLDHTKLRNIGYGDSNDTATVLAVRVYGLHGKLWPRMVIAVDFWPLPSFEGDESSPQCHLTLTVGKKKKGKWWERADMPTEFVPDIPDLLEEAAIELRRRLGNNKT